MKQKFFAKLCTPTVTINAKIFIDLEEYQEQDILPEARARIVTRFFGGSARINGDNIRYYPDKNKNNEPINEKFTFELHNE